MRKGSVLTEDDIKPEKRLSESKRINLLGVYVDVLTANETVDLVEKYIISKTPLHLMGVNADKINNSARDPLLRKIINSCGVINADGVSVVLASKILDGRGALPERVAGIDLMLSLSKLCAGKGYRAFLLGARQKIVEEAKTKLEGMYPGIQIVGVHNGYFDESSWGKVSDEIFKKAPDIVFVGITSPNKEYLIEFLQNCGHKAVFMGVGGSFDVISGSIKRSPKWMQRVGLEWLYRVIQEPKRLFKRYFIGNSEFIMRVIKERIIEKNGKNC